jgi:glycosyltransferase involved in cell wall biosynthesis
MIGGEREWRGGGWRSENRVLGRLPNSSAFVERLLLRLIGSCTVVATMGEAGRATLIEHGIDPARIRVLRPSVDTQRFLNPLNEGSHSYDVVTVGKLVPRKRMADLIRALARLRLHRPDLRAAIVGAGPLEPELRLLAAELEMSDCVEFLGFRTDVEAIYADARIFVLTSESEGLPVAMLEAMSTNLPPVVSDVGEIGTFVRDGESGCLFQAGDVEGLASRLEGLLDDEPLRQSMGAAAAGDVRAYASVDAVADEYRRLFFGSDAAGATSS